MDRARAALSVVERWSDEIVIESGVVALLPRFTGTIDPDGAGRTAAMILERVAALTPTEIWLAMLRDGSAVERIQAARMLAGRDSPQALQALIEAQADAEDRVRREATTSLGALPGPVALSRLLALRHDPESEAVCHAADDALAEILSLETGIEDD